MNYTFEFDPSQILGVSSEATLEEIRDAYRQKTKRHHPDVGGDEWAFRLVVRSYEILSTQRVFRRSTENGQRHVHETGWPRASEDGWRAYAASATPYGSAFSHAWNGTADASETPRAEPFTAKGPASAEPPDASADPHKVFRKVFGHDEEAATTGQDSPTARAPEPPPNPHAVMVEMLIIRFEIDTSLDLFLRTPEQRNLSCSLHISWPVEALAAEAESIEDALETLKSIQAAFDTSVKKTRPASKQSQVEEGRFVGWLTYPTATLAAEAFETFREQLARRKLVVEKYVREMTIPRHWN